MKKHQLKVPKVLARHKKKIMLFFVLLFVLIVGVPFTLFHLSSGCVVFGQPDTPTPSVLNPVATRVREELKKSVPNYKHPQESTILTFPEWYVVFSAQEYARYIEHNNPSDYPYFSSIAQYWCGYRAVTMLTKNYPFNSEYHLMLAVVGTSYTYEYGLKGIYDATIGRISSLIDGHETEEDHYAQRVWQEYGDFLPHTPWYSFPYGAKTIGVWTQTSFFGPHMLRKLERKLALTLEYGVKGIYAIAIKAATESIYAQPEMEMYSFSSTLSSQTLKDEPTVRFVQHVDQSTDVITLPRYDKFSQTLPSLARNHVSFYEIGGNNKIMLSAIAPRTFIYTLPGSLLFSLPVLIDPTKKRITIETPVTSVSTVINGLEARGVQIEHVFDY